MSRGGWESVKDTFKRFHTCVIICMCVSRSSSRPRIRDCKCGWVPRSAPRHDPHGTFFPSPTHPLHDQHHWKVLPDMLFMSCYYVLAHVHEHAHTHPYTASSVPSCSRYGCEHPSVNILGVNILRIPSLPLYVTVKGQWQRCRLPQLIS